MLFVVVILLLCVDDGVAVRPSAELVIAQPTKIADHLEAIHHLWRPAGEDEGKFVRMGHLGVGGEVVTKVIVHVLGFNLRRDHLQHIKVMRQLEVINVIGRRPRPATTL